MQNEEIDFLKSFSDPEAVAHYTEGPPRFFPGFADIHRMAAILLAEKSPEDAEILVLGAGGGLEIKAFAEMQPRWRFYGVDPALEMLMLAEKTLGPLNERARLQEGYIENAPDGPFDAATCLLTLHFLNLEDCQRTVAEIHRRLKPGAPFVAVHSSFPQEKEERSAWLSRYAAFAKASGVDPEMAENARAAVDKSLTLLSPDDDAALLRRAGFSDVSMFYAAFTWRGWVCYA